MATPVFVNDVLVSECICYFSNLQQTAITRRFWKCTTLLAPGIVTFGDVAKEIDLFAGTRFKNGLANDANYNGTRVRRVRPAPDTNQWEVDTTSAGAGVGGAIASPGQVCGLITLTSGRIGHRGEGRIYFPFPAVDFIQGDGVVTAAYTTILNSMGNKMTSQLIVTGGTGGQLGFVPVLCPSNTAFDTTDLTGYRSSTVFATQKRRGAYGRFNRPPF
jgi:hypothetical protein